MQSDDLSGDNECAEPSALRRFLLYGLSLPERAVRSTVGLTAGAATEAAQFLVPHAFQSSKTYEIVVRKSLDFLTADIGGVARKNAPAAADDQMMAHAAVSNFIDLAGTATLHLSPLWLMAIVSDVAYGSKTYVLELADELKKRGLIDETSTINHIDDVLEAVRTVSGNAATTLEKPPLSVDQLKQTLESTRAAIAAADYRAILPEAELKAQWQEMRAIAARENVSLLGVSAALTMNALGKLKTVSRGTLTGLEVAGGLFHKNVLAHYAESLKTIGERGLYQTLRESSAPYVEAVWNNFAGDTHTWTEEVVTGRMFTKAMQFVKSRFTKSDPADASTHGEATAPPPHNTQSKHGDTESTEKANI